MEKNIEIDVEVIKNSMIQKLFCMEAGVYENLLPETVSNLIKWQILKKLKI